MWQGAHDPTPTIEIYSPWCSLPICISGARIDLKFSHFLTVRKFLGATVYWMRIFSVLGELWGAPLDGAQLSTAKPDEWYKTQKPKTKPENNLLLIQYLLKKIVSSSHFTYSFFIFHTWAAKVLSMWVNPHQRATLVSGVQTQTPFWKKTSYSYNLYDSLRQQASQCEPCHRLSNSLVIGAVALKKQPVDIK